MNNNMKFKTILILAALLILINSNNLLSQTTNFKTISTIYDEAACDIITDSVNNYYIVGYRTNPYVPNKDTSIGMVWKLDAELSIIDSLIIKFSNKAVFLGNINQAPDNKYIISGFSYDTIMRYYKHSINLLKLNQNLQITDSTSIRFNDTLSGWGLRQDITFDNELLIWGSLINGIVTQPLNAFLGRYTLDLDSLNFKILELDFWYNKFTRKLISNNYFIAGGSKLTSSAPFEYMKFDSLFNFVNIEDIPEQNNPFDLKWDTDTSFYVISHWTTGNIHLFGMLYQKSINNLDDYIYITWGTADTFDLPATHNAIDYNNKDSIFVGGTNNFAYGQDVYAHVPSFFSIIQTDSLLNVRWERFYGGDAYYIMNSVLATNDGGCLLVGSKYDYENTNELQRDIYILKLNNEGLITSTNENQSSLMHEAIVYPNPGTNKFNVRIAAQYPESTVELYTINGQLLFKKDIIGKWAEIETSFLKSGTYIYKIYNKQGLFESGKWIKN